ncbi:MAG: cation transporter [Acidobacteria bacterium]|nr:cation transporter [Acidobacteriota bacterium]
MKAERLTMFGAVFAAFAASLCCILPLVFVVLGLGAFGAAAAFETARPYLLGVAAVLLAFGFYRAYFRREEACASGEECATKPVSRVSRVGLWLASVAVIAFALAPYYTGTLARQIIPSNTQPSDVGSQPVEVRAKYKITGMTCSGCAETIRLALERTTGVRRAEVSYERAEAVVDYDPQATTPEKIRDAINQTGFKAEIVR